MRSAIRLIVSFFSLLLAFAAVGIYYTNRIMFIKNKNSDEIVQRDRKAGINFKDFESLPKREATLSSPFGYPLKAIVVEPWDSRRYVVFCHGVTEDKMSSVKYMNLFIERGFNALIYDQRRHGESGGRTTSYGYYEKHDLKAVVDWLKADRGPGLFLGIHGESMGAATMLQYAGMLEDGADFYIADCPYSDFSEQLAHVIKTDTKLPHKAMLPVARLFLKLRDRYPLQEVSPLAAIEKISQPVLFIHSQDDSYILPQMTEQLYSLKKGPKQLYLASKGAHARSLTDNHDEYAKAVDDFLETYVSEKKQG